MTFRRQALLLLGSTLALAGPWACSSGGSTSTTTGTGGKMSSTHASSSGVTTGGGGSPGSANLGLACAQDSDCGDPLKCILPTAADPVFGGGPAAGYCSESCMMDSDCPSSGSCLMGASGPGDCVLTCTIGPVLMALDDPLSTDKCQGRNDSRCAPIDAEGTVFGCIPTCGEDSQCPTGEVCDPRLAVCVPAGSQSMGPPNGSACNAMATTPQCAGVCVSFSGGGNITLCTNVCELGGSLATTPNCGGLTKGLCGFSPMNNGAGDEGFCAPSCTAQSDCQNPNFWCFAFNGLTGTGAGEVPNGWCFGAVACPNGASDCAMQMGTTCTMTPGGPLCLSNAFPLPMADGGTDGGETDGGGTDGGGTDGGSTDGGSSDGGSTDGGTGGGGTGGGGAGGSDAGEPADAGDAG